MTKFTSTQQALEKMSELQYDIPEGYQEWIDAAENIAAILGDEAQSLSGEQRSMLLSAGALILRRGLREMMP